MSDTAIAVRPSVSMATPEYVLDRLALIDQALGETEDIAAALHLREVAEALRFMTRKADLARDIQNAAAKCRIDAERRLGELLKDMPKHPGGRPPGNPLHDERGFEEDGPATYEDIGIDYGQAHRWQTVASLPTEAYNEFVQEIVEEDRELTSAAVYRYSRNWLHKHANGQRPEKLGVVLFNEAGIGWDTLRKLRGLWRELLKRNIRITVREVID